MTQKSLTYTFHYWGAFCQGFFVLGGFCPEAFGDPIIKRGELGFH
jgi:hypothetical protein